MCPGDAGRGVPTRGNNGKTKKNDPWAGSERNVCDGTAAGRQVGDSADGFPGSPELDALIAEFQRDNPDGDNSD